MTSDVVAGIEGVRRVDGIWIPMPDGARLSARLWLPAEARVRPLPAVLEYIPYRKNDATAARDALTHPRLAAHGYACLRVDLRGSGDSDGLLLDEYGEQERRDALATIAWIAAQPWCDGSVAMIGLSWGGIAALQAAAARPPALKAIIAAGACDDRYYDDGCYYLGCLPGETVGWAAIMFALNTRPPDPAVVGERWRDLWIARLERTPHYLEIWLAHQRRDAYWRAGSLCEDYAAVAVPVYAVSGWSDCWPNTVPRLLEKLSAPCKGLMGPWSHRYPHMAIPGPGIDFVAEAAAWFDRWLKGLDNGIAEEPAYRAWIQESVPPQRYHAERPGRWVAEPAWPSPNVEPQVLVLDAAGLRDAAGPERALSVRSPQTVGLAGGEYMPWFVAGPAPELPGDQRPDDAGSLCFDGPPLEQRLEMLGRPVAHLELACDRALALVAVRLCDLARDGASTLVTRGVLNLAQRQGREQPRPLVPGERVRVAIPLNETGYAIPPGHRLRLAVSSSYWPLAWPVPEPATLTLFTGASELVLPVRPPSAQDARLRPFAPAPSADLGDRKVLRPPQASRRIVTDRCSGSTELTVDEDSGIVWLDEGGLAFGARGRQRYAILADDPLSALAEYTWTWEFARDGWQVRTRARTLLTSDAKSFRLRARLEAWDGEDRVAHRRWDRRFARDLF